VWRALRAGTLLTTSTATSKPTSQSAAASTRKAPSKEMGGVPMAGLWSSGGDDQRAARGAVVVKQCPHRPGISPAATSAVRHRRSAHARHCRPLDLWHVRLRFRRHGRLRRPQAVELWQADYAADLVRGCLVGVFAGPDKCWTAGITGADAGL